MTEEDLEELVKFTLSEDEDKEVVEQQKLTVDNLSKVMLTAKTLSDQMVEVDPFMERSLKFK